MTLPEILMGIGIGVTAILGLLNFVSSRHAKVREIKPQPLEVMEAESFVTSEMCKQQHAPLCQRIDALEKIAQDGVARRRQIHEDIAKAEASARAETDQLRRDAFKAVSDLGLRMESLPERIIATLRNLGVIGGRES